MYLVLKWKRGEISGGALGKDNSVASVLGLAPKKRTNKKLPPDVTSKPSNGCQTSRDGGYWGNGEMKWEGTGGVFKALPDRKITAPRHSEPPRRCFRVGFVKAFQLAWINPSKMQSIEI